MTDRDTTDDGIERNRRRFLKRAAATTAVGFAAASGTASARTLSQASVDPARVETALERHGDAVLAALAADDRLARGDVAELPTRSVGDLGEARADGGTVALARRDGADEFVTVADAGDGRLRVSVQPARDRVYAVHRSADGDALTVYEADGSRYDAADECCTIESYCTHIRDPCDVLCVKETKLGCPCGGGDPTYVSSCDCLC